MLYYTKLSLLNCTRWVLTTISYKLMDLPLSNGNKLSLMHVQSPLQFCQVFRMQGSVVGPLLFLIYFDACNHIKFLYH